MLRRASAASPLGRLIIRTNTARSSTMKVGTPKTAHSLTACSWARRISSMGAPDSTSATHLVARDADAVEHVGHDLGDPQVEPLVVARREEGDVRLEEPVGVLVAHDHAGGQRQQVLGLLRVVPDRGAPSATWTWLKREGQEGHVPVGSVGQGDGDVLMGIAGERTAVVPGDSKAS